ncbi:hypothetical protein WJX75_000884 [Coccomyxa subellipsoidea]|uniref:Uncharacterized protein n=1 Tax=Coccomyxa subellipsoidea TaxID=248742 RepID=A0ABR2YQK5_9CHLO
MLCTSGALFEGPLLSAEVISTVKPSLPSSKVQKEVKGLIGGINELTACKALLEPHLTAADAGLAELALSIPLAQGLRDRRNLHCWVEAAVQASGERAAPDVLLTIGLQNTGPYPGASERHCTSALLKTVRIDILHLMRPVLFQTAYERACLPEKPEQQHTASLAVMVHALSSMPTASLLLRQILSVGVEDCLQSQGDHVSGTGALALMTSSSVTGIVSLGCKSATLSIHAALQSTSATTPRARLELTLKCSDVTVLAAAHESVSWRLQEWQRMLPGLVVLTRVREIERLFWSAHRLTCVSYSASQQPCRRQGRE